MNKYNFTYKLKNEDSQNIHFRHYISNSPKNVCQKITNRLLRKTNEAIIEFSIIIINIDSNKNYYYKVIASKYDTPIFKKINKYKIIQLRYKIFIQKIPNDLIEFMENQDK